MMTEAEKNQTISETSNGMSTIEFKDRLNGYDPEAPVMYQLMDAVGCSIDRASGVLNALFWAFENKGDRPDDAQVCGAVDAAICELKDIKMILEHYYESTKQKKP